MNLMGAAMELPQKKKELVFLVIFCIFLRTGIVSAALKEDPIKSTQSDTVPVTEELITREGEPGPASPTIKMNDTSKFLVKKPYQKADQEEDIEKPEETSTPWWEDWFTWEEDEQGSLNPE